MKKLIFAFILVALATTIFAQETEQFIPDYGIELEGYSETKRFASDTIDIDTKLKFMSPYFQENRVIFVYKVSEYNDTILVKEKKDYKIELPLNATVQGKKVYEWLNDLYSPTDTAILKGLAEKLFYYDLMNK